MARKAPPPPPLPAWDEPPSYTMSKSAFAADMAVTPAAVSQWIARGMPVRDDGLLDLLATAKWILANLDQMQGHRTRVEARAIHAYCVGLENERVRVRQTIEAAADAARIAALAAGLADADAVALADCVAAGTVARINPALTGDGNLALPPPPAGLWERWEAAAV